MNEYHWMWLNRDGESSIRTKGYFGPEDTPPRTKNYIYYNPEGVQESMNRDNYDYLLGPGSTAKEKWNLQSYLMEIETEFIRSSRDFAGVLSFPYLSNNRGFTGDWFKDPIKDLIPSQTLKCQYHCFAPFAVFINVEDGRYQKNPKNFEPGSIQAINLFGINDTPEKKEGTFNLKIIDKNKNTVFEKSGDVSIDEFWQKLIPITIKIPDTPGGYLLLSGMKDKNGTSPAQLCRRYIRIGNVPDAVFPEYEIDLPPEWPR